MVSSVKKYAWLLLPLAVFVGVILHSHYTFKTLNNKKNTEEIDKLDQLVVSQDKVVERVYTTVVKEVRGKDAEIKSAVKALSPDAVAVSLDALVKEYRRERDAGN